MVDESWRIVRIGGATGAQMTDAELEAYLQDRNRAKSPIAQWQALPSTD